MVDLIERRNFNPYSLYEDFDENDKEKYHEEVTMRRLRKYLVSNTVALNDFKRTGKDQPKDKIFWHLDLDFDKINDQELEYQIWRRLRGKDLSEGYVKLSK